MRLRFLFPLERNARLLVSMLSCILDISQESRDLDDALCDASKKDRELSLFGHTIPVATHMEER